MSIMKKLFNGEVYPFEDMQDSKETLSARNKLYKCLEKIDDVCPKEEDAFFSDKICEHISVIETNAAEQGFKLGLSLGLKIMSESYK